jgi:hypothetical protein
MERCASARTCQICQVERCSSIAESTRSAAVSSHAGSSSHAIDGIGLSALRTISCTASGPPSTWAAWANHACRCSVRLRGWCLACRVSRVACCASCSDSTGVGGRPWALWKSVASTARRASMAARRVDHLAVRAGSTPTISRIGLFRGSRSGRSANRRPRLSRRCCSRAVL